MVGTRAVVVYLLLAICHAQTGGGAKITGRVLDPEGLPAARVTLTLRNTLSGAQHQQVTTESGEFVFSGVSDGRYALEASATGLTGATRIVDVDDRQSPAAIEFRLVLAQVAQEVTVVSGSRVEELQRESPVRVEVATRQQMLDTGYERVSDVLREIPGIVTRSGSTASVGAEQIEGIDSRQVLILQDGLPVVGARGIKSGMVNLNRQDAGKLDRVEVAKGAASALYGSDAIGGVINMITREPSDRFAMGLSLSGGSLGALDGRADFGTKWKKFSLFTDLESHRQDAYALIPSTRNTVGPDFTRNDLLLKLRYAFNDRAAVGVSATAYHNEQFGLTSTTPGLTRGTSNDSTQSYAVTGDFLLTSSTTLQTRAYAARYDENSRTDYVDTIGPSFGFANLNEVYHRLDATIGQQLGRWQMVQGGVEWAQDQYRGANRLVGDNAGQQVTTNDVWFQDRIQPLRRLMLTVGGRYQHQSLYGNHLVPKAGLVYQLTERWSVRASFGKGFRAPDLGQLYYRFANPASFYQVIGNPTLRPETSTSISAGLWYRRTRYQFGANLYRHRLNDLIDSYSAGTPQTDIQLAALLAPYGVPLSFTPLLNRMTFIYLNLNRAMTEGFELNGDVAITRRILFAGAYNYLDGVDRATGLLLPQRHRHQGYVRADYDNPRLGFRANIRGTFYSKWPLNPAAGTYGYGYQVWDVYAAKGMSHGLEAFGLIDNLAGSTDRKLALTTPAFDRPDYGRTFRVGVRYTFRRAE